MRDLIRELIEAKGLEMKDLSLKMGRGHSYLFEYLTKNKPKKLDEEDRVILAKLLGVPESSLKEPSKINPDTVLPPVVRKKVFNRTVAGATTDQPDQLKVLGMGEGGQDGWNCLNGEIVQFIGRPEHLKGVPGAYAVYVRGSSMMPRYEDGEIVYVHPAKPVQPGSWVLVQRRNPADEDHPLAIVKQLVRRSGTKVVLGQLNPPKQFDVPAADIITIHRIVGSREA